MDPASILAFITFASSTSNIILKTTKTIYQAPIEILSLNNELNDLQLVLLELHSFQQISKHNPETHGSELEGSAGHFDAAFEKCFGRIRQLFEQINELTSSVFVKRQDGRHSFERLAWMRKKSAVLKLKLELSAARQALRDLIEARTASRITRIELTLDNLSTTTLANVTGATPPSEEKNEGLEGANAAPLLLSPGLENYEQSLKSLPPTSTVAFEAFRKAKCDIRCPCPCHLRYSFLKSSLFGSVFGSLFVGYVGIPTINSVCKLGVCHSSSVRAYRLVYTFPVWFLKQTLEVAFGSNYFGEPEFNVRMHNRVEYMSDDSLFQLARKGDIASMQKKLASRQASPHDVSLRGGLSAFDWALQYLVATGDTKPCKLLIDAGVDLNLEDDYGLTNAFNATTVLLSPKSKDYNTKLGDLLSFIDIATLWEMPHLHQVTVDLLPLDLKAEIKKFPHKSHINAVDIKQRTALHWAAMRGDLDAIQALLLAGAERTPVDAQGETPLLLAVSSSNVECVELLLMSDIQINAKDARADSAMLIAAWAADSPAMIRLLASVGADVESRNDRGVSALQSAACLNHPKNIETFLELGADVNSFDQNGDTALFECIYYGCMESLRVIAKCEVDRFHCNKKGWSLLHVLALYGDKEMFTELQHLLPGIDIQCVDEAGRTAGIALKGRADVDPGFVAMFMECLLEMKERDEEAEDGRSVKSFESAVEVQVGC